MIIAKYISSALKNATRTIKVVCFGKSDTREANECAPFGIDSNPIAGMQAIYSDTSTNGRPVIIGYINSNQLAAVGENRMYSTDANGAQKFYIWQKNDGTCEIGGNDDNMVRYSKLNTALTNYINSLNTAIAAGVTSAGGTYTPPTTPLDLSAAKILRVKTMQSDS